MTMDSASTPSPKPPVKRRRNPLLRALLVLAGIVVVLALLVPFLVVGVAGSRIAVFAQPRFMNTVSKLERAEAVRPFTLPKDSSITAARAGAAFNALQPPTTSTSHFVMKSTPATQQSAWPEPKLAPELFTTARSSMFTGGPAPDKILALAVAGLKPDELQFLDDVAHAKVWSDVDIVARAPAIDIMGGRFEVPFAEDANIFEMPILKFAGTKDLAYAGVSRAAYYLAKSQKDSAESALRTVTSLGFALSDNGTLIIDQLIGAVIVGIGREALIQFYTLTKNPAAQVIKSRLDSIDAVAKVAAKDSGTRLSSREGIIAQAGNSKLPRGVRFESLTSLSVLPCTNLRELILGPRQDVTDAFTRASKALARYPSEMAQIDLQRRLLDHPLPSFREDAVVPSLAMSAASLGSTLFRNPRLVACTSLVFL
jgi:hypothetical protein